MAASRLIIFSVISMMMVAKITCQATDDPHGNSPFGLRVNAPSNDRGGGALVDLKLPFLRVLAGGFGDRKDPNNPASGSGGGGADVRIGDFLRVIGFGDGARGSGGGGADVRLGAPGGNNNFPILSSILAGLGRPGGISVSAGGGGTPRIGVHPENLKPEPIENLNVEPDFSSFQRSNEAVIRSRSINAPIDPLGIGAQFERFVAGLQ